ncbi:MAG TPA: PilX N-terminal domain-containing pilus assembly protein [Aromatoleum sp.]|uniref:PilX N-terminal domain-containing pilus assembly protein n=1 Tax=Aromatoleum sp. TaxID=2307007 RepID=UPI002B459350|nr:PilX N-terminal domain-containing pilus assembly protein [Aromatoleum sp.]HJV25673.1 PilX N-terminal domain-containing pilus assembly protein [Aromatoleum sp.]
MRIENRSLERQGGAATLLVTMVLLVAATLMVLYTSRALVGEQRMSANEMRANQAFEAAQGGLELSIERVNANKTFNAASVNGVWSSSNSSYTVAYCSTGTFPAAQQCADRSSGGITPACTAPGAGDATAWVVACGWSDDNSARKRIVSFVAQSQPVPGTIANPLTSHGAVTFSGNSTVVNYFNNLTVWTGNTLANTGNTGKTVIRRPTSTAGALTSNQVDTEVGNGNQVCNTNQAPDLICTTSTGVFGPDVIQSDSSLAGLTADQFFENFLGLPPTLYKATEAKEVVAGANAGTITDGGKVYWVDGNATISQDIGSLEHPVVIVVDGDLTLSGNSTIFGIVFVKGNLATSGGPKIRGALLATGDVNSAGALNVIYDPEAIRNTKTLGTYASAPGAWRDF